MILGALRAENKTLLVGDRTSEANVAGRPRGWRFTSLRITRIHVSLTPCAGGGRFAPIFHQTWQFPVTSDLLGWLRNRQEQYVIDYCRVESRALHPPQIWGVIDLRAVNRR